MSSLSTAIFLEEYNMLKVLYSKLFFEIYVLPVEKQYVFIV